MRRALLIGALASWLLLALAPSAAAQATTSVVRQTVPIHTQLFGSCVGVLEIDGTLHLLNVITIDPTGSVHIQDMSTLRFTGTNLNTGDRYQATTVSRTSSTIGSDQLPFVVTAVLAEHLISPTGPDLLVRGIFHITISPDGTVTSLVSLEHVECR
jgi:hypothetical protein